MSGTLCVQNARSSCPFLRTSAALCLTLGGWLPFLLALALALAGLGRPAWGQTPAALRARQLELREKMAASDFGRPLVMDSFQRDDRLSGEIHAQLATQFEQIAAALQPAQAWCDILMLHLNVKLCRVHGTPEQPRLEVVVGRKYDQPLEEAFLLDFGLRVLSSRPDYLALQLEADDGPFGTRDYRIGLELVPTAAGGSFLRLAYSYRSGLAARLALQGYLVTLGRGKVGFSVVGQGPDGSPEYVGGVRGVVERNTMRYYLALESYLAALRLPSAQRTEQRLQAWFDASERYARQLHELERAEYLAMKRRELARLQAGAVAPR
ncbi:MAG: hypothetical protein RLZZ555_980 [Pseudomonadota bacterium]|jgi:hypothetical protein